MFDIFIERGEGIILKGLDMKKLFLNNKIVFFILLVTSLITFFTGCNINEQIKDIPTLQLIYQQDNKTKKTILPPGTATWHYGDSIIHADAFHPLDAIGKIPEIEKEDLAEIKLNFSLPPTSYTVRVWTEEYIGNNEAYEDYYEEVDISNDTLMVPEDDLGYIYLVHAFWPQGNVHYSFYVTKPEMADNNTSPDVITSPDDITTPVHIKDVLIGGLSNNVWMNYDMRIIR